MRLVAVGDGLFGDRRGGGKRYLSEVTARLGATGHKVSVVVPKLRPELASEETVAGARVLRHERGNGPAAFLSRYRSAQRAFEQATAGGCDLINVHFAQTAFPALRSRAAKGVPVVYNFQGPWPGEVWVERRALASRLSWRDRCLHGVATPLVVGAMLWMERAVARRADRFIVLSDFSRRTVCRWYGVRPDRVDVIPSGVDIGLFRPHPRRDLLRAELGLPSDRWLLFTARRLVARMGLELLLRTVKLVSAQLPVVLAIAGDGPLRAPLEKASTEMDVHHLVRWLGGISDEDLVKFHQAADLVVVPTVAYEGFGLVTVEALACGTPVVATPVGASPEILSALQPALVASAAEPAALAEAILRASRNAPGREECRDYAEARYSWEAVFPLVEAELVAVAELGGAGRRGDGETGG